MLVIGNGLGTVIAVQFVSAIEAEQGGNEASRERPRGVVLLAPFGTV